MSNQYTALRGLDGFQFPVYASKGCGDRGRVLARLCQGAYYFLSDTFATHPDVTVLVLALEDWSHYTTEPTYGMPHCLDEHLLVLAGENSDFWTSMVPSLDTVTSETAAAVRAAYGQPDGTVDVSPFFDLLTIHELAHVFHEQAAIQFPRKWIQEFFANLSLHTYVATQQPAQLPVLEAFPRLIVEADSLHVRYHRLADFERLYMAVGPQNYGWYQCRLHVAAREVFEAGGISVLQDLWGAFSRADMPISNEQLARKLGSVHPRLEQVFARWPEDSATVSAKIQHTPTGGADGIGS